MGLLMLVALGTHGVMTLVSEQARREREADLLRVGEAYARAIGSYYEASPGMVKQWPRSLADLVSDNRYVGTLRHIRRLYPDPVTRGLEWGLIESDDGGISGVFSQSTDSPIRTSAIDLGVVRLPDARQYSDWRFSFAPEASGLSLRRSP
ncbi:MAG: type II secretion system protein [Ramlibacter sp.]|nr:type II secretion system protein [Ramlibacter sp.]